MINPKCDFTSLTTRQIIDADFTMDSPEPLIKPFNTFIVADPSVLTPENSHDGRWHMFFHTTLGVYHFDSSDGLSFNNRGKIVSDAMRPDINYIDGEYYLFYERTRNLLMNGLNIIGLAKWESEIYCKKSSDLKAWSVSWPVIRQSREYEKAGKGYSISNPFLFSDGNKNRLYYSCSLTYIKDCGFCEPTYISYAESDRTDKNYRSAQSPIISPDKNSEYLNLCSGCLKVYKTSDGYIGIQNGIYEKDGKSHSAIMLLSSDDGLNFRFERVLVQPGMFKNADWMKQYVYASCLVRYGSELRLYFNGRDTSSIIRGRECIGYVKANI